MNTLSGPARDSGSFGNTAAPPSAAICWGSARMFWLVGCLLIPGEGQAVDGLRDRRGDFKGLLGAGVAAVSAVGGAGGDSAGATIDGADRPGTWVNRSLGGSGGPLVGRAGGSATAMALGASALGSDCQEVPAENGPVDWQGGDEGAGSLAGGLGLASGPVLWRVLSGHPFSDGPGGSLADRIVGSGLAPSEVCAAAKGREIGLFWCEGSRRRLLPEVASAAGGMDLGQAAIHGADEGRGDNGRRAKEDGCVAFGEGASLEVEDAAAAAARDALGMDLPHAVCGAAGGGRSGSDWDFEMDLGGRTVAIPVVGSTCGLLLGLASFAFRRRRYS